MTTTTNVVFGCDESGAKGYADQVEAYACEVGVFAGILVPQECEATARPECQAIYDRYKPTTGKLHIAELPPDQQEALRQDVYAAIRKLNLPCFWYAIHVDGLNDWYLRQKKDPRGCQAGRVGGRTAAASGQTEQPSGQAGFDA